MCDEKLQEIWRANEIVTPKHFESHPPVIRKNYFSKSLNIVTRLKRIFWIEILLGLIAYILLMWFALSTDFLDRTYGISSTLSAILITFCYSFYDYIFYYKYFKDMNDALQKAHNLDIRSALELQKSSIQKYRARSTRFTTLLLLIGVVLSLLDYILQGDFVSVILYIVIGIPFTYAGMTSYYDYFYKPYEEELLVLQLQLAAED